ncbi:tRNA pseudouridine(55) synthase TruB [Roseitranquillus sediminis]|uniref:tRNA pseudouridine(55) synthase TruB n=1 Tax=Roseitranquillus sediminis TaxID=2809051 RepID=UPI001D0BF600|nr:tRNA pseudouridine(55) synthase TruB [Roseitranquillus sediminis]MBM9593680.1 tRNA pseudouridine(55) synthase TruB [Roseitranquillus sediminis]
MGRRRKGRNVSGWVIVDKPAGPTSTQVTGRVRRAFDARKAGHAGTLDPAATGVLAVALGEATKTMPFVADASKSYRFTVRLGAATDTDDAEGEIIATSLERPSDEALHSILPRFTGDIMQAPPRYSAIHVEGRRAHEVARAGGDVVIPARPLRVERLVMVNRPDADHVELEMACGKGGYVRSIARDLGEALGCLGHVLTLRRIAAGPFREDHAVALAEVEAEPEAQLRPVETALVGLPEAPCDDAAAGRLAHGNPAPVAGSDAPIAWASHGGRAVAIGRVAGGILHPARVFR